jgi:hypothetical protein
MEVLKMKQLNNQIYVNVVEYVQTLLQILKSVNVELQSINLSDSYKNWLYNAKTDIEQTLNIQE